MDRQCAVTSQGVKLDLKSDVFLDFKRRQMANQVTAMTTPLYEQSNCSGKHSQHY